MSEENSEGTVRLDVPDHLQYSPDHVWIDTSQDPAVLGVTEYAADQLGDLAVEPVVCPVSGTVAYVNRSASDDPGVINSDPYGEGWIMKMTLDDDEPGLLTADEYSKMLRKLG